MAAVLELNQVRVEDSIHEGEEGVHRHELAPGEGLRLREKTDNNYVSMSSGMIMTLLLCAFVALDLPSCTHKKGDSTG